MRKSSRGAQNPAWMAAQRILALREPDESYADLARRLGLTPKTIDNYYRGASGASVAAVATAVQKGHVNAHWLLTGEGARYDDPEARRREADLHRQVQEAAQRAREIATDLERATGFVAKATAEDSADAAPPDDSRESP